MDYTDMTDEEYDALDEELSKTIPKLGPNGSGWLSQRELRISGLSAMTVNYLLTMAKAVNKSPIQIIEDLVREKVTAAVNLAAQA
ncbi:MAG: hypothetical protein FWH12_09935 [Treponema sp.]|nr:hypothetical protein [Treponema sp.]